MLLEDPLQGRILYVDDCPSADTAREAFNAAAYDPVRILRRERVEAAAAPKPVV